MDPADDPRTYGNPEGEKATLREYLTNYRLTLDLKRPTCRARRPPARVHRRPHRTVAVASRRSLSAPEATFVRVDGTIRAYRQDDLPAVLETWAAASVVGHSFLDESFLARERVAIAEEYLPNATTWVWALNDVSVGFISLSGDEIGGLFVRPAVHGRGIGRALVLQAMSGRSQLDVEVFERNEIGRGFYQALGFRQIGSGVEPDTGEPSLHLRLTGLS
jgi:ribosomal protein S18 acetylase RimI-like enzyme